MLRLKSVHQNCVLGRCVHVVSNFIATSPFLIYLGGNMALYEWKFWTYMIKSLRFYVGLVTQLWLRIKVYLK